MLGALESRVPLKRVLAKFRAPLRAPLLRVQKEKAYFTGSFKGSMQELYRRSLS